MVTKRRLSELLELLYSAAAGSCTWDPFLELYGRLVHAPTNGIIIQNACNNLQVTAFVGIDPAMRRDYDEYYWRTDEWFQASRGMMRPGLIFFGEDLCAESRLLKSEFYNDYLRRSDCMFHQFGGFAAGIQGTVAVISSLRSRRGGAFGRENVETLRFLTPHIERALALRQRTFQLEGKGRFLECALDSLAEAVFLLAENGRPTLLNSQAMDLVRSGDGLAIRNNRLVAINHEENTLLNSLIRTVTGSLQSVDSTRSVVRVTKKNGKGLSVFVGPWRFQNDFGDENPVAIIFVRDDEHAVPALRDTLQRIFGLTVAETRLAMQLLEGKSLTEAAAESGTSRNTARSQLQSVFAKTHTSRQSQLILVLKGAIPAPGAL